MVIYLPGWKIFMSMFKYIGEIISKIPLGQRLIALSILTTGIIVLTLGPKLIENITPENTELQKTITSLRTELKTLRTDLKTAQTEISTLNGTIISGERSCTQKLIERENEIVDEISNLQKKLKKPERHYQLERYDTSGEVAASATYYPRVTDNSDDLVKSLDKLKNQIKTGQKKMN